MKSEYKVFTARMHQAFHVALSSLVLAVFALLLSSCAFWYTFFYNHSPPSPPSSTLSASPELNENMQKLFSSLTSKHSLASSSFPSSDSLPSSSLSSSCPPPTTCPKCPVCDVTDSSGSNHYSDEPESAENDKESNFTDVKESGNVGKVLSTGAWKFDSSYVYPFDASLASYLNTIVRNRTVLELGAGRGHYTKAFKESASQVNAYDGAEGIEDLSDGLVMRADLTEHLNLGMHDWVICMEVGEHVPKEFELSVIDNIHRHNSKGVILSWAVLGQHGIGHVNNHSNRYIKRLMRILGYISDERAEKKARKAATLWWFQQSVMIFRKMDVPPA